MLFYQLLLIDHISAFVRYCDLDELDVVRFHYMSKDVDLGNHLVDVSGVRKLTEDAELFVD